MSTEPVKAADCYVSTFCGPARMDGGERRMVQLDDGHGHALSWSLDGARQVALELLRQSTPDIRELAPLSNQVLVEAFSHRLDQAHPGDEELFHLPAGLAARLARVSTSACNAWAERDPMLGNGRDTRAVYAMTLGMVTAAGIMLDVISQQTLEG